MSQASRKTPVVELGAFYPGEHDPQKPADIAVVIPTMARPSLANALRTIFSQDYQGPIQVLFGVDKPSALPDIVKSTIAGRPGRFSVMAMTLPYSTARRHGGLHPAMDGGAIRTILTFMANSRHVAYLDDDNAWRPSHLRELHGAIQSHAFAYARRMLVDENTKRELGVDIWDSVGPGKGRFAPVGGFVDPSCLMIDKLWTHEALHRWSDTPSGTPEPGSDTWFFRAISQLPYGCSDEITVDYTIRTSNILQKFLLEDISPAVAQEHFSPLVIVSRVSPG